MRRFLGAGMVLGVLAVVAAGQDGPVTIKIRKGEVGDVIKESKDDTFTTKMTITAMGQTQEKGEARTVKMTFLDEVLVKAPGAKKPTKSKRTITSIEATEDGKAKELNLAGKTVLIETKDKKPTYTFEDGTPLNADQLKYLDAEKPDDTADRPDFEDVVLPKNPVKVGEAWKLDTELIAKAFGGEFAIDAKKSSASGKLTKVYEKAGRRHGVIEIKMDLVTTKIGEGVQALPLKDGSKMEIEGTLDACIDGTAESGTMTMTMKANMEGEVMGVALKLSMTGKKTTTAEPVKK